MPTGAALRPHPQAADRQGNIVEHDNDPLRRDLVVIRQRPHGLPREIHIRHWLDEQDPALRDRCEACQRLVLEAVHRHMLGRCQRVDAAEADIMPGTRIGRPGISQAYQHIVYGRFSKQHA